MHRVLRCIGCFAEFEDVSLGSPRHIEFFRFFCNALRGLNLVIEVVVVVIIVIEVVAVIVVFIILVKVERYQCLTVSGKIANGSNKGQQG